MNASIIGFTSFASTLSISFRIKILSKILCQPHFYLPRCQIYFFVLDWLKISLGGVFMLKKFFLTLAAIFFFTSNVYAEKILFIPHDDRPVSSQQPADVVAQLGYEILMPPTELLTKPDELWAWFYENAPLADAAVVGSDSLLYGGLIPSRSHNIDVDILNSRVENFKTLR